MEGAIRKQRKLEDVQTSVSTSCFAGSCPMTK